MKLAKPTPYALGAESAANKRKRAPPLRFGLASRQAWLSGYDTETAYQQAQLEMFDGPRATKEKTTVY